MEKENQPLVSVIMTVYNGEKFLREAVHSILNQSYGNLELIVIDDGSTDGTPAILESFSDARVKISRNPSNLGVPASVNRGLAETKGAFIVRHDADDVSLPERFGQQVAFLNTHPSIGLVSTDYWLIDDQNRILDFIRLPGENSTLQERLQKGNLFASGSVMVRREIWEGVGGFRDAFLTSHDYDLWLRIAEVTEMANLQTPLFRYRFHSSSISRTKRALQFAEKNLALSLARNRRSGKAEGPIPSDILPQFPPDPGQLFLTFRNEIYLYYACDQLPLATERIGNAIEIQTAAGPEENKRLWIEWALGKAHHLSEIRNRSHDGEDFLRWLALALEAYQIQLSLPAVLGHYYVDSAFLAYRNGKKALVGGYFQRAVSNDKKWFFNLGLWSILLKSKFSLFSGKRVSEKSA